MIAMKRHPSWRELNRLADDELDADARGAALKHLAACPRCSANMSLLNDLREAGRGMRHPSPPKELLDDILRDRARGLRTILPAVPPSPRPARRLLPAAAAVAVIASLAGLATLTLTSEAGAGASELMVDPALPMPGERIRLAYRPGVELRGETELRLRLRLRGPDSEPPRQTLGAYDEVILRPDGDGLYVGSFQLPPDFAYAVMAVEDLSGARLDDRGGRLWSVRAHADDGTPLPDAIRQEFLVLQNRSWPEARDALHEMTLLYPGMAEGWSMQLTYEDHTRPPAEEAVNRAGHREHFRQLERQLEQGNPSADEVAAMVRYAGALEDQAAVEHWLGRLEALAPAHRLAMNYRMVGLGSDQVEATQYIESLWSVEEYRTETVCRAGFRAAEVANDADLAREWATRCLPLADDPGFALRLALVLVAQEETRERGIRAIRMLLDHVSEQTAEERPLHYTPEEVQRESRVLRTTLRVGLGRQLLDSGEPVAAVLELDAAEDLGLWLPDLYRLRLEALLSIGDMSEARSDFHRLDADPVYPRESVDSLARLFPSMTRVEREEGRGQAEDEMIERVLDLEVRRGLPPGRLTTPAGQSLALETLLSGRPTILLLWDRRALEEPDDIAQVLRATDLLAGGPGQILWVTPEPASESLQSFRRRYGLELPVYQDPGSELAAALGYWGVRSYIVIDGTGRIRTHAHSLMEAVRHLEVLLLGSRDSA
jgi:hypothetical protein